MKSQRVWWLLVSLLACGAIGCGETPQPVVDQPKTAVEEPDTVVSKPDVTEEPGSPDEITNSIGMKLKLIPAGEFLMGSAKSPQEILRMFDLRESFPVNFANEHPQHKVRITKPFYFGVHEVTVGQFRQFVEATDYKTDAEKDGRGGSGWNESKGKYEHQDPKYTWRNAGFAQTDAHPVVNVSWNDAVAFCQWLSGTEGKTYRLPTEAEWEYACRAGATTLYHHGDDPEGLARVGNVLDATAKKKLTNYQSWRYIEADDGHVFTAPVGGFRPNGFGLCDMHGNVSEWCADWHDSDYYANSPPSDPPGPERAASRVTRGSAGWPYDASCCRSAIRGRCRPQDRGSPLGFRVAGVPSGESKPIVKKLKTQQEESKAAVSHPDVMEEAKPATKKPEPADWQLPPDAPQPAIAPFDADQARQHQESWAEYHGVPVEITNSIGMKLKLIPAGEFMMGSPESGDGGPSWVKPQHKVRITKPFYLGVCEVTQAEYEKVMGKNPSWFSKGGRGAKGVSGKDTSRHPVEQVGWDDAVEFCKKLSAKEGKTYRLPTEAEWEYTCRAGTTTLYSFGDDAASLGEYAWYRDNSDEKTHPVGEKKPNAWGLHDMHGNVWEWCQDCYGEYSSDAVTNPTGPSQGSLRVFRGGGWGSDARSCRAAYRRRLEPQVRDDGLGFRVAADPSGR